MSLALCIRPHAALFLPAVAIQLVDEFRASGNARRPAVWLLSFVLTTFIWILPLAMSGVLLDFLAAVGHNNTPSDGRGLRAAALLVNVLKQFDTFGFIAVSIAVCMIPKPDRRLASVAAVWLGGWSSHCSTNRSARGITPTLRIPFHLILAVNVAVLSDLLLNTRRIPASFKLIAFLLVLGVSCRSRPDFCTLRPSLKATLAGVRGERSDGPPPGYRRGPVNVAGYYQWADYFATADYLQPVASRKTRIANALKGDPAIVGLLGGFSAFPAESISWLRMVKRTTRRGLRRPWRTSLTRSSSGLRTRPGPTRRSSSTCSNRRSRRLYEPEARFGVIEVWRRKESPGLGPRSRPS